MMRPKWLMLCAAALAGGVCGCGSSGPKYVPVSGTLTLDGKPYGDGVVVFLPKATPGNPNPGRSSAGETDSNGHFVLKTDEMKNGGRIWGPAVQLYALRSQRNWGIGDFGDLLRLIGQWARRGASVIGLSPLHALFPHDPARASPYSPSSRLALNVLYIEVDALDEIRTGGAARALVESAPFQQRLRQLRDAERVDYSGVAAAKFQALALAYGEFRERHLNRATSRSRAFREFQQREGEPLRHHALFEALQERFHAQDAAAWGWPAWPAEYRDPGGAAVREFCEQHLERVEYFEYLQWEAMRQLERVVDRCKALGLAGGLYLDIAVSVDRGGAEAWANQQCYALAPRPL